MDECLVQVQNYTDISNGSCSAYQDFSYDCWCEVSKTIDQCSSDGGFIDYLGGALCTLMCRPTDLYWIYVVYILWLLWWCLSLAFTADTFFVPVVQWIAAILGMNETLAGVTIVALGNAGPDIAGGFAAFGQINAETSRIVFNSLLSGGFFVISLLPAIICLWTPMIPARRPFLRDNLFYVLSCSVFFVFSYTDGRIQWYESLTLLLIYCAYVATVVGGNWYNRKKHPEKYIRGPDGIFIREKSYFLKDILAEENKGHSNNAFQPTDDINHKDFSCQAFDTLDFPRGTDAPQETSFHNLDTKSVKSARSTVRIRVNGTLDHSDHLTRSGTIRSRISIPPISKHRMRSLTNASMYSDCQAVAERMNVPVKNWKDEFKSCFKLLENDDWANQTWVSKTISILMVPFYIGGRWTIPQLPINNDKRQAVWNKPLAMIQAFLVPIVFCVFLYQYRMPAFGPLPRIALSVIIGFGLSLLVGLTTDLQKPPKYWCIFPFVGFGTGMLWIYIEANEILNILTALGTFWNVSNAVMGLTFLGWANNVGDFVADLTIAKEGQSRCAFSAAFAGPPLYLLASVGLACFVTSAANGFTDIPINIQNVEIVLFICVIVCAMASLLPLVFRRFHADRFVAICLIVAYLFAFVISLLTGLEILWPPTASSPSSSQQ